MTRFFILIILFLPLAGFSQVYINQTKSKIKEETATLLKGNDSLNAEYAESDSTLEIKIRGKNGIDSDHIYKFDAQGKCISQKTITHCDTCHKKMLQPLLALKKYRWRRINQNQYVAKFSENIFLEIQEIGQTYWFVIFKLNLGRKMYRSLF
jgi:hypothetical protein